MPATADPDPWIAVRLLGSVSIQVDGRELELVGDRLRMLLTVLALAAGETLPTGVLAERIWGDRPPANIAPSMHTLMTRFRRTIGADLVTTSGGYSLRVTPEQVDVLRFGRLLRDAAQATDQVAEEQLLSEALGLWNGPPFGGLRSEWLDSQEVPRLTEQYLAAVERLADLRGSQDHYGESLATLRELTALHPLRESLWVRLLRLMKQTGRTAEALDLYESLRQRLDNELGVDPGIELRTLYAELLADDPAPTTVPRQLPADVRTFSGRRDALAFLDQLGDSVVVTLDGSGGVGKTALAVHWAHRVRHRYPDGQLYLNLRGYSPEDAVAPTTALEFMLRGLEVDSEQIPPDLDGRVALFRSKLADRRMLVILDNARDVAQVRPLLPGPGSLVVVTSRNQLRGLVARDGAIRLNVDRFSTDESLELLAAVLPEQDYDQSDLDRFAELCSRLPLALVIAAERAGRTAGTTDLSSQLADASARLDRLELMDDPLSSVRAVFSWSYDSLPPEPARLFRLLGAGPWPAVNAAAAGALLGTGKQTALGALDVLIEANLVEARRADRFELHDLLRLYAAEVASGELSPAELDEAIGRLAEWCAHTAGGARIALGGDHRFDLLGEPPAWLEPQQFASGKEAMVWLTAAWDSLLTIVQACAAHGQHRQAAVLTAMLWTYLDQLRVTTKESTELHQLALRSAHEAGDDLVGAVLLNQLGTVYAMAGEFEDASEKFAAAVPLFVAVGSRVGESMARENLGMALGLIGKFDEGFVELEAAVALVDDGTDSIELAGAKNSLAMGYIVAERFAEAIPVAQSSVELFDRLGQDDGVADGLDTIAEAATGLGDHATAAASMKRVADLRAEQGNEITELFALVKLGEAYAAMNDHTAAKAAWERSLYLLDRLGPVQTRYTVEELTTLIDSLRSAGDGLAQGSGAVAGE